MLLKCCQEMYGKPELDWLRYENCQKNAVKKIYGKPDLNWLRYGREKITF